MPDYMFLLESRLSPEQRAVMMRVQELSAAMGFNLYLTGGTVRDLITGASLRDLDFTVEGNPSKIARELEKGGAKILLEDEKLRHIEVLFAGDVLWGIPGMILAIPVLGIVKIGCDHIENLQPVGLLLGESRPLRQRWSLFRRRADVRS